MKPSQLERPEFPPLLRCDDPQAWGGLKGRTFTVLQYGYALQAGFLANQAPLRAASLTYTTMLSLVPFLAIAFSVLKGLGAQNALEPLLLQLAGDSEETISKIIGYVNNTNVKSLGIIGLLGLILTVVTLLGSVEEAFNATWKVRGMRPILRRFSDYLSVALIGPVLLLVAVSISSGLKSQWVVQWLVQRTYLGDAVLYLLKLIPYLSIWVAMVFLYLFIPNARVRITSALLGGALAGTAWQVAQWGYFYFQIGVANYNAIYGALAALPIFMVWVYTSWLIVLFGLEVVYAHQHRGKGSASLLPFSAGTTAGEELALAMLLQVCRRFREGRPPPTTEELSDELRMPIAVAEDLLEELADAGFLAASAGKRPGWLPAREPADITVNGLLELLRGEMVIADGPHDMNLAANVLMRGAAGERAALQGVTVLDLLTGPQSEAVGDAPL